MRRVQRSRRSLLAACAALPLAVAAAQRPVPPAPAVPTGVALDVTRDGNAFVVTARADLQADARTAWDTITEVERLPQFVPNVTRVRVLSRQPRARGEVLAVAFEGNFRLFFLSFPTHVWLDVEHVPYTDVLARLRPPPPGHTAPSSLKHFNGRYTLTTVGAGRDGATRVRFDYNAEFELAQPLPPVLGTLFGTRAVRAMLREQFAALVSEIERRSRGRQGLLPSR
jgi:hypothetical protein